MRVSRVFAFSFVLNLDLKYAFHFFTVIQRAHIVQLACFLEHLYCGLQRHNSVSFSLSFGFGLFSV